MIVDSWIVIEPRVTNNRVPASGKHVRLAGMDDRPGGNRAESTPGGLVWQRSLCLDREPQAEHYFICVQHADGRRNNVVPWLWTLESLRSTGHASLLCYVLQQVQQFRSLGEDFAMQHTDTEYLGQLDLSPDAKVANNPGQWRTL